MAISTTHFFRSRGWGTVWLLAVALITLPSAGYAITPGGEYEYQQAITVAFRDHLQWGTQIAWTYGPLGYMNVLAYVDFRTWLLALLANLVAHAGFFAVLILFLVRTKARPWLWFLMGGIILVFFERYKGFDFERFPVLDHRAALVALVLLYLASEEQSRRAAAWFAGGAGLVIGFLLLDKGTFMVEGGAIVAVYCILGLARGKVGSVAALLASTVLGFAGLWLLTGQSIANIPAYFRSSYEITAGYPPAMSWFSEAPDAHPMLQLGFAVAILLTTAACLLFTLWKRDWPLFRLLLLASPLIFVAYKNSFVRFDEIHALTFWSLASVLLGLVVVRALAPADGPRRRVPAAVAGVAIVACAILVLGGGVTIGKSPDLRPVVLFPDNVLSYRHAASLVLNANRRAEEDTQVQNALRAAYPLPPNVVDQLRQGDVDVVPWDIQLAFAYNLRWNPQPVLQSYAAYRPYLDDLNAQHFTGPNAPQFVVFALQTIDGRYPLFDEPKAYRVLLERYQVLYQLPNVVVFERRTDAATFQERGLGSATGRIGDWLQVPNHGDQPLYGRLQVGYAALGSALNLLDRPPELHIRFQYGGGQVSPAYRFVPAVAPDGLELSGYVPDLGTFADLAQGRFDQPIEAIQVQSDGPAQAYVDRVSVAFSTTAAS